ncbi:methyl-accepting chemotaxis protein [Lachnospiraceae bacterium XPB1003]|nr:methyl-accepting chemotaxis protein [Lachnospiraceae bacterium XPB1003]
MDNNIAKKRKSRFSIKAKIILLVILAGAFTSGIISFSLVHRVKSTISSVVGQDAIAVAKLIAGELDGDVVARLDPGDEATSNYKKTMETLNNALASSDEIETIYVVGYREGTPVYVASPEYDVIGTPVEDAWKNEADTALASEEYATGKLDKVDGVYVTTVYVSVHNTNGESVAAVGIDYDAQAILDSEKEMYFWIIVSLIVAMVVVVILAVIVANGISKGLKTVNGKILDLVNSNGDLTKEIEITSNDEVSDITESINGLLGFIRQIITNISGSSRTLADSIDNSQKITTDTVDKIQSVSGTISSMSDSMSLTSDTLEGVKGSAENVLALVSEMSKSVNRMSDYAEEMNERAKKVSDHADDAVKDAEDSSERMAETMNLRIEEAGQVDSIKTLTDRILAISEETNLLSLNASIEAARAGESGRGFAVVAGQIGLLAETSAQTATEIQEISQKVIDSVQGLVEESERMIKYIRENTIGGYRTLKDTGDHYSEDAMRISELMNDTVEKFKQIEQSMHEMTGSVDSVTDLVERNVMDIEDVVSSARDMNDNMKKNMDAVNENASIVSKLDGEVSKFRI